MKNSGRTTQFSAIVAIAILASACGTSNRMSQRSFGGGFGEGKKTEVAKSTSSQVPAQIPFEVANPQVQSTSSSAPSTATTTPTSKIAATGTNAAKTAVSILAEPGKHNVFKAIKEAKKTLVKPNGGGPVDTSNFLVWLLVLILCFIIPPLAYYLATGNINLMFWICLICFLLAAGYLFGFHLAGLLGLISIVIALLGLLT